VGDTAGETFGTSITISITEQPYLVIGSPNRVFEGEEQYRGAAQLFQWRSLSFGAPSAWYREGDILEGSAESDHFGTSVAISGDKGKLAVASRDHDRARGYVAVYDRDTYDSLAPKSSLLNGERQRDESGASVSINGPGSVVVSGAD
jgi:hypothetical protein